MTERWTEIETATRRNLIVFVDDWKGAAPVRDTTPVAYVGRAYRNNETFALLADVLESAESHLWHVSKRNAGSLFVSDHFDDILRLLEESSSILLSQNWTRRQYAQPEVKEFVSSLPPECRSAWRVDSPYGLALLEFTLRLRWYLANTELAQLGEHEALAVLVVADNADWLGKSPTCGLHRLTLPSSTQALVRRVTVETIVVRQKQRSEHLSLLRFLGLADSEAWAFGRHLSTRLPAGDTFHERMAAWQRTGRDHGLTMADVQLGLSSGGGRSREYQEHAIGWPLSGQAVSLTTIGDRYYLARSLARQMVKLERVKNGLTDAACDILYQDVFARLSSTVFSPETQGSWME